MTRRRKVKAQDPRVREPLDAELLAMKRVTGILLKLDKAAALRIVKYVSDRLAEPKQAELPLGNGEATP